MPGGRAMRKLLLGLSLVLLLFVSPGATAAAQASTLLSDDYEGAVKWNTNSSGWALSTTRVYGGTYSAHAPSQIGTSPMMAYGPFDLMNATSAELDFELWYSAPTAAGSATKYGSFCVGYSTDGSSYTYPYQWSGSTSGEWWPTEFALGDWPVLGEQQVWIGFKTTQWNASAYSEGAYVDDLSLTATVPDTTPPTTTATGAVNGRWYRTAVTVSLAAGDNAGGSGVAFTEYALDDERPGRRARASPCRRPPTTRATCSTRSTTAPPTPPATSRGRRLSGSASTRAGRRPRPTPPRRDAATRRRSSTGSWRWAPTAVRRR